MPQGRERVISVESFKPQSRRELISGSLGVIFFFPFFLSLLFFFPFSLREAESVGFWRRWDKIGTHLFIMYDMVEWVWTSSNVNKIARQEKKKRFFFNRRQSVHFASMSPLLDVYHTKLDHTKLDMNIKQWIMGHWKHLSVVFRLLFHDISSSRYSQLTHSYVNH